MSNKKQFKDNLYARVRIRPLIYYANLRKYLDEEWLIDEIQESKFGISHPNGYFVDIGHDARREWVDDFSKQDSLKRGTILLKVQITLLDGERKVEPLT
ncbi:MAG: hypothetical protein ACRD8U_18425, partial [Pyrinomonadaceae bacterium]